MQPKKDDLPLQIEEESPKGFYQLTSDQVIHDLQKDIQSLEEQRAIISQKPITDPKDQDITESDNDSFIDNEDPNTCNQINQLMSQHGYPPIRTKVYSKLTRALDIEELKPIIQDMLYRIENAKPCSENNETSQFEELKAENKILKEEIMKLQEMTYKGKEDELTIKNIGLEINEQDPYKKGKNNNNNDYEKQTEELINKNQKMTYEYEQANSNIATLEKELNLYKAKAENQNKLSEELNMLSTENNKLASEMQEKANDIKYLSIQLEKANCEKSEMSKENDALKEKLFQTTKSELYEYVTQLLGSLYR